MAIGVLEPVRCSEWAAPIVPGLKSDKETIQICGDFKQIVNTSSKIYLPKAEDIFVNLTGGKVFSKLDLSHAYQQVCLDHDSHK